MGPLGISRIRHQLAGGGVFNIKMQNGRVGQKPHYDYELCIGRRLLYAREGVSLYIFLEVPKQRRDKSR